jgi:hypothetical protein
MKNGNLSQITLMYLVIVFVAITMITGAALAAGPKDLPDLTKVQAKEIDLKRGTYNLGSTGLRG